MFGAKVAWSCSLDNTATIVAPWNLHMAARASIGEYSVIRCRDKVKMGHDSCIGRGVYILTASHNISSPDFEMISSPITIGDDVWIATQSIVCRGVNIGDGSVVGAGALVVKDVEPWTVVGGNPAKFIKKREIKI